MAKITGSVSSHYDLRCVVFNESMYDKSMNPRWAVSVTHRPVLTELPMMTREEPRRSDIARERCQILLVGWLSLCKSV